MSRWWLPGASLRRRVRWRCCPWGWSRARVSDPYQHSAISIYSLLFDLDDFVFERFNVFITQLEAQLEGSIGDAAFLLQQSRVPGPGPHQIPSPTLLLSWRTPQSPIWRSQALCGADII